MTDSYAFLRLRGPGRDTTALRSVLQDQLFGAWRQDGVAVWGVWAGLFGIASNELIVVVAAAGARDLEAFTAPLASSAVDVEVIDSLLLAPTVRPERPTPCDRPGLYVFRFFEVLGRDVEEIAALSKEAWETFENTDAYAAEPQGLFRQAGQGAEESGRMLLVTWYDGLESWQTSRQPNPAATENFLRRRELTAGTVALATRLLEPFA
ncbi:MAG: hypothetical protein AAGE43_00545 [Pseudomonadota bacterium]